MTEETNRAEPMRLTLIGMSGAGKTFWTKKLAAAQYPAVSCDDCIEQKLAPRLTTGGYTGINGVAAWMGWPDSATYTERESEYLAEEIHTLDEILTELERQPQKSLVLDTTGSVIYTGNNLLMRLRRQMTIVHLAASAKEQQLLIERYLHDPSRCCGAARFNHGGRKTSETVARCYPALVAARVRAMKHSRIARCKLPNCGTDGLTPPHS